MQPQPRVNFGGLFSLQRIDASFIASILLGSGFGLFAAMFMGMSPAVAFALGFCAIAGLLSSPALIFALRVGPWWRGLLFVSSITAAVAIITAAATRRGDGPFFSVIVSIGVYLLVSILRGILAPEFYATATATNRCPNCDYDLAGLAPRATCPECGGTNEPGEGKLGRSRPGP